MKKEGRDLVTEAVNDAKALKEAALLAAKNELLESMAPAIKNLLEKNIKDALSERQSANFGSDQAKDYTSDKKTIKFHENEKPEGDSNMAENTDDLNLESLASFFTEADEPEEDGEESKREEEEEEVDEASIPMLGEEADEEVQESKKKDEDEDMSEEVEISESELRKVYEAALATEVAVKKGFSEMTPMGELEDVAKDVAKGINPVSKSEKMWGEKPESDLESKQDFMMKEMIQRGLAENKSLRTNLKKAVEMIRTLGSRLHEVNLFNAKVLHVNRILNTNARLTSEQKKVVLESIDKARSIEEVRTVFEVINSSFSVASKLTESTGRKPAANAQRARTSGGANQKVLSESVDRNSDYSRLAKLAGIVK